MAAAPVRRILGVDPGTRITGWGIVDVNGNAVRLVAAGYVKTKGPEMANRLAEIQTAIADVIARHTPGGLAVETPYVGKNPRSALAIGMARGAALVAAALADMPVHEYPPSTVKKSVVGRGGASKEQVSAMVRVLLGLQAVPEPADVTDALAVALAHAHRLRSAGPPPRART